MSILDFNWIAFLFCLVFVVFVRSLLRKWLPFVILSTTTAATAGFVVFMALGVLAYSNSFRLPVGFVMLLLCLAYLSFLVGATFVQIYLGRKQAMRELVLPPIKDCRVAMTLAVLYIVPSFLWFVGSGGIPRALGTFLGGYAHREYLSQIMELQTSINWGMSAFVTQITRTIITCLWVVGFSGFPRISMVLYVLYVLPIFETYVARSSILGQLVVPLFAYIIVYRPSRRILFVLLSLSVLSTLAFFSWNSSARLGLNYDASIDRIVSDTLRDGGGSLVPATDILFWNLRGNPWHYILNLFGFIIPRSIWTSKPLLLYNIEITYLVTGRVPGFGNPVITSTMLGEAWYYFGPAGTVILMFLFGAFAQILDIVLSKSIWLVGAHCIAIYLSFILMRSTFLTYYQSGISLLIVASIMSMARIVLGRR